LCPDDGRGVSSHRSAHRLPLIIAGFGDDLPRRAQDFG
jgi:hypothetical protein